MTREEHLVFCKKCVNRKFDPQQGIICKITDKIADFEDECNSYENEFPDVEEASTPVGEGSNLEIIATLTEDVKEKIRDHQEPVFAVVGGLFLSIFCALTWAAITVATEYQIAYMAIGVGIIVGMGVRFFGAGIDQIYGYLGGFFALVGCVLGNLFSQVGFIAQAESMSYFQVLTLLDIDTIILIFEESFSIIDVVFYGVAIFEGYKFAFRPISSDIIDGKNLIPNHANFRLPLVTASFLLISFIAYTLSKGVSGLQTFYYENGEVLSSGEYLNGVEDGQWMYYYESGNIQAKAQFENGKENGEWEWYYENNELMRKGTFVNGLTEGIWYNYYPNGVINDSSNYVNGRLHGESNVFFENGRINQKGRYIRDKQDGKWDVFFENGQINVACTFKIGQPVGLWKYWKVDGKLMQELTYEEDEEIKIINAWDPQGLPLVKDGFGLYKSYNDKGILMELGRVEDGRNIGIWKTYYSNSKLKEEGKYEANSYKVINTWLADGTEQVIDGAGDYIRYFENSTDVAEKGRIENGLREGYWDTFHENSIIMEQELFYSKGKINGRSVSYFPNGNVYSEGDFKEDKREGEWNWYFESGQLQCSVNIVAGNKEGSQIFWSEMGQKSMEEIYENNELIDVIML